MGKVKVEANFSSFLRAPFGTKVARIKTLESFEDAFALLEARTSLDISLSDGKIEVLPGRSAVW